MPWDDNKDPLGLWFFSYKNVCLLITSNNRNDLFYSTTADIVYLLGITGLIHIFYLHFERFHKAFKCCAVNYFADLSC